jgi:hypothetical protein
MPRSSWMIAPAVDGRQRAAGQEQGGHCADRFTVPPGVWKGRRARAYRAWGNRSHPGPALAQPHHRPAGSPANVDLVDHRDQPLPGAVEGDVGPQRRREPPDALAAPSRRQDERLEPATDVVGPAVRDDERDTAGGL